MVVNPNFKLVYELINIATSLYFVYIADLYFIHNLIIFLHTSFYAGFRCAAW